MCPFCETNFSFCTAYHPSMIPLIYARLIASCLAPFSIPVTQRSSSPFRHLRTGSTFSTQPKCTVSLYHQKEFALRGLTVASISWLQSLHGAVNSILEVRLAPFLPCKMTGTFRVTSGWLSWLTSWFWSTWCGQDFVFTVRLTLFRWWACFIAGHIKWSRQMAVSVEPTKVISEGEGRCWSLEVERLAWLLRLLCARRFKLLFLSQLLKRRAMVHCW